MSQTNARNAYAIAFAAGIVIWFAATAASGRREAWDAGIYWMLFYPLAIAVAALLGYRHPDRPWRWAVTLFLAQFVAMGLRSGEIGSLAPLGLVVFGMLSLPAVAAARFAARHAGSK
jgi:hypothetical protein